VLAGAEAAGKYSVVEAGAGKGVYTFAVADAGAALFVFYAYTDSTDGETMLVINQLQGYGRCLSCTLPCRTKGKRPALV